MRNFTLIFVLFLSFVSAGCSKSPTEPQIPTATPIPVVTATPVPTSVPTATATPDLVNCYVELVSSLPVACSFDLHTWGKNSPTDTELFSGTVVLDASNNFTIRLINSGIYVHNSGAGIRFITANRTPQIVLNIKLHRIVNGVDTAYNDGYVVQAFTDTTIFF